MSIDEYIDELRLHGTRELAEEVYRLEQENIQLKKGIKKLSTKRNKYKNKYLKAKKYYCKQLEAKNKGFLANVEETCEYAKKCDEYKEMVDKATEVLEKYKLVCLSRLDKTSGMDIGAYQYYIDKLNYVLNILKEEEQ